MGEPTPRRAWSSPSLIVLVRRKPEEAVLGACKNEAGIADRSNTNGNCHQYLPSPCDPCTSLGSS